MPGNYCLASTLAKSLPSSKGKSATAGALGAQSPAERELLLAREAFERRDVKSLGAIREKFRAAFPEHPLAAYPEYWWLIAGISQSTSVAVGQAGEFRGFLNANAENVLAEGLRKEWLRALGKLDQWDLFTAEFPQLNVDDADLICHQWRQRIGAGDRGALTEALAFWRAGRTVPDSCHAVFEQLRAARMIEAESAWLRVRKLLEDNQLADARRSAALIDKLPAMFERTTASIWLNPGGYVDKLRPDWKARANIELYLFALNRIARADAGRAATALDKSGKDLPATDRAYAWSQIGLYGAMQHEPAAGGWFEKAGDAPLNDTQAAWKVRAALRGGDWSGVRSAINSMSAAEKRDPAWRYWLARAESAGGNEAGAAKLRETLARENNFYGLLAAEESGVANTPAWKGWKPSPVDLDAVAKRPAIARALALYRLEMKSEGLREWQFAIRDMNDQQLLAAAELARAANVPDRAISAAERTVMLHDFSQRFPTPYRDNLRVSAKAEGLDEAWVYGLIRQESRFMADAKSRVGAAGLMQLMPATARWAAKRVGMSEFSPNRVADIPVNLALGSYYLKHVLDDLGHPVLATAAYNAGPGRARRWRSDVALEGAIYAESIPFAETRDYVKKVMANAWFYAHQAGIANISLKRMMGTVPGRSDGKAGVSSLVGATAPVMADAVRVSNAAGATP